MSLDGSPMQTPPTTSAPPSGASAQVGKILAIVLSAYERHLNVILGDFAVAGARQFFDETQRDSDQGQSRYRPLDRPQAQ